MKSMLLAGALLTGLPVLATAQDYRTLDQSRRHMGEEALSVHIEFGVGRLLIGAAEAPTLYRLGLTWDDETFHPHVRYDPGAGRLIADIDTDGGNFRFREETRQRLDLALSRSVPLRLHVKFGAGSADLDLGGLSLESAQIQTGASDSHIRFSEPNAITCRRMTLEVGAAEFRAERLGNARCDRIDVNSAIGEITVDLTGAWDEGTHRIELSVGLGELRVRLPADAGIRVEVHKFLAGMDYDRLTRRGRYYYSDNWDDAPVKLQIELRATFGDIDVTWVD